MRDYIKALGIQEHRAKNTKGVEQIAKADRNARYALCRTGRSEPMSHRR